MNIFKLLNYSKKALKLETEIELSYLYGKKLKEIEYMKLKKPRYSGVIFRSLFFMYTVFKNAGFFYDKEKKKDIYFYAATKNQINSLYSTIEAVTRKEYNFLVAVTDNSYDKKNDGESFSFIKYNVKVIIVAMLLFLKKAWPLYKKFKKENRIIEISWHFNKFCEAYLYVPYFLNVLSDISPELVVMSNDHNVSNRSLRVACELLGIKTLYMQHASVTEIFPPLEFDYALLDGALACKIYSDCYVFQNEKNTRIENNIKKCNVFLSGQKKKVNLSTKIEKNNRIIIGLAVNQIDDIHCVIRVLERIKVLGLCCVIRTHPFQEKKFINQLVSFKEGLDWLIWSDSKVESLTSFFSNVSVVVAGNTSIHIEAALAGLPTLYYEMSDLVIRPDYYGYVKNGVSKKLPKEFTESDLQTQIDSSNSKERIKSIKSYSETYQTRWQGREGELSCKVIENIIEEKNINKLFSEEKSSIYKRVRRVLE